MSISRRLALIVVASSFVACTRRSPQVGAETGGTSGLVIKGSDTMVLLGQRWAEQFMKEHARTSIQVTGGGSGTGIAALINGSTDLATASRPMKDSEKAQAKSKRGAEPVETKVALDALAVYVAEKNPMTEIDLASLSKIYRGEIRNWKDLGGPDRKITLYGRENNSGTYAYFKEHVLDGKDFAPEVQTLAGTSAVANAVKGDDSGIGYGGFAYASGIRLLKVKKTANEVAVEPKLESARDGSYPISRFLYVYSAGEPTGLAKDFLAWVTSDAGQKVVSDVGYFPLPK
jgi:phosphate transport system substrate-binding protein